MKTQNQTAGKTAQTQVFKGPDFRIVREGDSYFLEMKRKLTAIEAGGIVEYYHSAVPQFVSADEVEKMTVQQWHEEEAQVNLL